MIKSVIKYMTERRNKIYSKPFSIRDAIEVTRYAARLEKNGEDYRQSFDYVIKDKSDPYAW